MTEALATETALATGTDRTPPVVHTVFLTLTTQPAWLALSRHRREEIITGEVAPLLGRYAPGTTLRWFDAEAFSAAPTDVAVVTTTDLGAWYDLAEQLRDTSLWSVPYFRVEQILLTREEAFRGLGERLGGRSRTAGDGGMTAR